MRVWITETIGGFVDIGDTEAAMNDLIQLAEKDGIEGIEKEHYFKITHRDISIDED
jgi:hypothetical protein